MTPYNDLDGVAMLFGGLPIPGGAASPESAAGGGRTPRPYKRKEGGQGREPWELTAAREAARLQQEEDDAIAAAEAEAAALEEQEPPYGGVLGGAQASAEGRVPTKDDRRKFATARDEMEVSRVFDVHLSASADIVPIFTVKSYSSISDRCFCCRCAACTATCFRSSSTDTSSDCCSRYHVDKSR